MNILMATNTYLPHVGGVARSVTSFCDSYRQLGHKVLVLAPEFEGDSLSTEQVIRIPSITNFNNSGFSVRLPIPGFLEERLNEFKPEIVHSHHPFLIGDTALRIAAMRGLPLIFTHHTMYEHYTHYVSGEAPLFQKFAARLSAGYANLCQGVIAPSESIAKLLRDRGVESPLVTIPTGVDVNAFSHGDGSAVRRKFGIPESAPLIGFVSRLAHEKNLRFLAKAARRFLYGNQHAHFLVVGEGPGRRDLEHTLLKRELRHRVHFAGQCEGQALIDCYRALDVFVFASLSETQGLVVAEAMAADVPVVALDAPGVRDVVRDGLNGALIGPGDERGFAAAISWIVNASSEDRRRLQDGVRATARSLSVERCAEKSLRFYRECLDTRHRPAVATEAEWESILRVGEAQWSILGNAANAFLEAMRDSLRMKRRGRGRVTAHDLLARFARYRDRMSLKILNLPRYESTARRQRLVMIQIDGLSRVECERALWNGRLPFLRSLLVRQNYRLMSLYSGLPSTTPAVQGEIFYGRKTAVPAFAFYSRERRRLMRMFEPIAARSIENQLMRSGPALLSGGTSYSNIFSGGAKEVHLSPARFSWGRLLFGPSPLHLLALCALHAWTILRTAALILMEVVLAILSCVAGIGMGRSAFRELLFVPSRIAVGVVIRELVSAGAVLDVARGSPIIHLNYLGYDEHAHRRGPNSYFAHWALKGIDRAIRRVWEACQSAETDGRSRPEVWIYSDHGQERSTPYIRLTGMTLDQAVTHGIEQVFGAPVRFALAEQGPVAHLYLLDSTRYEQKLELARVLVGGKRIPAIYVKSPLGDIDVITPEGKERIESAFPRLLAPYYCFYPSRPGECDTLFTTLLEDWRRVIHHPDAGDIILSGWRRGSDPVTFAHENGSHGGLGPHETHAFAILPEAALPRSMVKPVLRPLDLRHFAFMRMRFSDSPFADSPQMSPPAREAFPPGVQERS